MGPTPRPVSAKIYEFPRTRRPDAIDEKLRAAPTRRGAPTLVAVDWGSAWYHDAAIRDAERDRKP